MGAAAQSSSTSVTSTSMPVTDASPSEQPLLEAAEQVGGVHAPRVRRTRPHLKVVQHHAQRQPLGELTRDSPPISRPGALPAARASTTRDDLPMPGSPLTPDHRSLTTPEGLDTRTDDRELDESEGPGAGSSSCASSQARTRSSNILAAGSKCRRPIGSRTCAARERSSTRWTPTGNASSRITSTGYHIPFVHRDSLARWKAEDQYVRCKARGQDYLGFAMHEGSQLLLPFPGYDGFPPMPQIDKDKARHLLHHGAAGDDDDAGQRRCPRLPERADIGQEVAPDGQFAVPEIVVRARRFRAAERRTTTGATTSSWARTRRSRCASTPGSSRPMLASRGSAPEAHLNQIANWISIG